MIKWLLRQCKKRLMIVRPQGDQPIYLVYNSAQRAHLVDRLTTRGKAQIERPDQQTL